MTTRKSRYAEAAMVLDWLRANKPANDLDERMLDYPTTEVHVAEDESGISVVMPLHLGLILESVGYKPEATAEEKLLGCLALSRDAERIAAENRIKELYYVSSDSRFDEAAMKHAGYEKVACYRKKVSQ